MEGVKRDISGKKVPRTTKKGSKTATPGIIIGSCDLSLAHQEEHFPWSQLPRELRVKVLQNLRRSDIDRCRSLDRETFELIRCNRHSIKGRMLTHLRIQLESKRGFSMHLQCSGKGEVKMRVSYGMFCSKHFTTSPSYNRIQKVLGNADAHHLIIDKTSVVADEILLPILSLLENTGSTVRIFSMIGTLCNISSPTLFRFIYSVAQVEIHLKRIQLMAWDGKLTSEILKFIVTRQRFSLTWVEGAYFQIDDNALAKLTAKDFVIGTPNMITFIGLKSFIERFANGDLSLVRGEIFTHLSLRGMSLPSVPSVKVEVVKVRRRTFNGNIIKFSTENP